MNEDAASDHHQHLRARPILGVGRGRMIVIACALGIVFPVAIMRSHGDALVERWSAAQRAVDGNTFWAWAAFFGSPFFWFTASVVSFGVAAAFNWSNTARWTGMLALGVMWSGLADIAVAGEALGTATVGAAACVMTLWQPRLWPFCAALALFNFPLLALWDRELTVFGLPLFPAALFALWALLIAALAWILEGRDD